MPILTNAALSTIKYKAEEIWKDGQYAKQYEVQAEAVKKIVAEQEATIKELSSTDKDNTVEVSWLDTTAIVDEDVDEGDECSLEEDELSTNKKTYELDLTRRAGFSIDDNDLALSIYDFEIAAARGILASKKVLDEYLSRQAILALNAFAGVNQAPAPFTYDATEKSTMVDADKYDSKLFSHLIQHSILNRVTSPYVLDSGGLFIDHLNAGFDSGNADGKGDKARYDSLRLAFDQFSFAGAGLTDPSLFLIGKNSIAFASKNYNKQTVPTLVNFEDGNQYRYSVDSDVIPGVKYDVYYSLKCVGKRMKHTWRLMVNAGFFLNPEAGQTTKVGGRIVTNSGILKYSKQSV
jgi:hypothetical protein